MEIGSEVHIELPFLQRYLISSGYLEPGATSNAQSAPALELHQHRPTGNHNIPGTEL